MLTVNAYGATSAAGPLVPMTTQRRDPGPGDVLVEISYCGICHTDISHARSEWCPEPYPLIPGHEFTGVVAAVGSGVSRHAVGDRVGVGLHGRLLPRVRQLPQGPGAVLPQGGHPDLRLG